MDRIWQIAAITFLLGGLLVAPITLPTNIDAYAAKNQTVYLALTGLNCASCKFIVKSVLTQLEGVELVDVSYENRQARVVFDPDLVEPQKLIEAVNTTSFHAEIKQPSFEK